MAEMNPAFDEFWEQHEDAAIVCGNTKESLVGAAIAAATSIIDQHIPSLTDEDDALIDERWTRIGAIDEGVDNADLALRTCKCGKKIDGFYEYVDHLKEVLRG